MFLTTATTATTVWNGAKDLWVTTVPTSWGYEDIFLSGFAYHVGGAGVPGGTKVNWSGEFEVEKNCIDFSWKWGAAVYTTFPPQPVKSTNGEIGVQPVGGNQWGWHQSGNPAGTPQNYTAY